MSSAIQNRYEFVYLFDVENGNPNGDPDAGNMPRLDPETSHGLVTDVCLKRKVRNYVELAREGAPGFKIYVQERAVLNQRHDKAFVENPDVECVVDKKKNKKKAKTEEGARKITRWMCDNFYDIRTFGAVMTTDINCGQVRGPVQIAFARSVEPIVPMEVSITRMAVTNERDLEKERTMGRKHVVPYALYRAEGFVSAKLAEKTGFGDGDLALLWEALRGMFDHDHSAARGKMAARGLTVFRHALALGNAPAHELFQRVTVRRAAQSSGPARAFSDYTVSLDREGLSEGVEVDELL